MTLYEKDTSFSPGWMIGGAVVMIVANGFGGLFMAALGVTNLWIMIGAVCAIYALTGFFIGLKSEGRTIIEASLAAAIATCVGVAVQVARARIEVTPLALAIGCVPPFACGILGAFVGEKVQGDSVEVQD